MNAPSPSKPDPLGDTGTADVRHVREQIAALYDGDIKRHVAESHTIVQPLIEKLGLKYGVPTPRRSEQSPADPIKTA